MLMPTNVGLQVRQMVLSWVSDLADSITVGFFCSSSYICFPLEPYKKRLATGTMLMKPNMCTWCILLYSKSIPAEMGI